MNIKLFGIFKQKIKFFLYKNIINIDCRELALPMVKWIWYWYTIVKRKFNFTVVVCEYIYFFLIIPLYTFSR